MKGLLKTAQGASRKMDFLQMCSLPQAGRFSARKSVHVCRGKAFVKCWIQGSFIEQTFIRYMFLLSHYIFPSLPPSHVPFCSLSGSLLLLSQWQGHLSWPLRERRGGNKWNINTPVSLPPLYLASWGCWAQSPISGPSEPCNQHCQAQFPADTLGWHSKWRVGTLGRLAGRLTATAAVLEGSMEHVKPPSVSPGAPHGWTGLTLSGAWGWIDPEPREATTHQWQPRKSIAECAQCL